METAGLPTGHALPAEPSTARSMASDASPKPTMSRSPSYRAKAAHISARASLSDPFTNMLQREKYVDPHAEIDLQQLVQSNLVRLNSKCDLGAFLVEAGDFAAVACWEPPTATGAMPYQVTAEQAAKTGRFVFADFLRAIERVKGTVIGKGESYWKLSLMAREPGRQEKGVVRAVIEQGLGMAQKEGLPVWCEAGNERARDIYEYFGFKVLEELKFGKGEYDKEGRMVSDGEGVSTWLMVREWKEDEDGR